ncbi:MAG: hypothetical protein KC549_13685 [Myxococcales bacterium]|nr:hypothetical protein [Myxococcales bacterium]
MGNRHAGLKGEQDCGGVLPAHQRLKCALRDQTMRKSGNRHGDLTTPERAAAAGAPLGGPSTPLPKSESTEDEERIGGIGLRHGHMRGQPRQQRPHRGVAAAVKGEAGEASVVQAGEGQ